MSNLSLKLSLLFAKITCSPRLNRTNKVFYLFLSKMSLETNKDKEPFSLSLTIMFCCIIKSKSSTI